MQPEVTRARRGDLVQRRPVGSRPGALWNEREVRGDEQAVQHHAMIARLAGAVVDLIGEGVGPGASIGYAKTCVKHCNIRPSRKELAKASEFASISVTMTQTVTQRNFLSTER